MLTNSNNTNWDNLLMADRTNYIKLGLNNGISDLGTCKYNNRESKSK